MQAKHMIMLRDSVIQDIIQFLEHCEGNKRLSNQLADCSKTCYCASEWLAALCIDYDLIYILHVLKTEVNLCVLMFAVYGKSVAAVVEQPLEEEKMHPGKNTVTFEARELKSLFMRLVWSTVMERNTNCKYLLLIDCNVSLSSKYL